MGYKKALLTSRISTSRYMYDTLLLLTLTNNALTPELSTYMYIVHESHKHYCIVGQLSSSDKKPCNTTELYGVQLFGFIC